jgi:hypothetical protein
LAQVVNFELAPTLNIVTEGHKRCVKALSKDQIKSGDHLESCLVHGIYVLHRGEK